MGNYENEIAIVENKRGFLGIKRHFWEVSERKNGNLTLPLDWSFLDVSIHNNISDMFLGVFFPIGQIS